MSGITLPDLLVEREQALFRDANRAMNTGNISARMAVYAIDVENSMVDLSNLRIENEHLKQVTEQNNGWTEIASDILPPHDPNFVQLSIDVLLMSQEGHIYQDRYNFETGLWQKWSKWLVEFTHWHYLIPGPKPITTTSEK